MLDLPDSSVNCELFSLQYLFPINLEFSEELFSISDAIQLDKFMKRAGCMHTIIFFLIFSLNFEISR